MAWVSLASRSRRCWHRGDCGRIVTTFKLPNFKVSLSDFRIQNFCRWLRNPRSASQVRGSGATRHRPAELSLTPLAPPRTRQNRRTRRRAGFLEGPGERAEAPAAPPPARGRRAAAASRCSASSTTSHVLVEWAEAGEAVGDDLGRALDELDVAGRSRRDQEDARRRARSEERDRHDPSRRRRHRVAGLGRDAAAHVPALDGAPRLQARGHGSAAGRRGRHQERDVHRRRRLRLRADARRSRRASPGAHLAVRPGGAPAHVVRVGLRLAGAARGRRNRDRRQGPAHRHLPLERRRRAARQRHGFRGAHHALADRHRRLVPERAVAAPEPRRRR